MNYSVKITFVVEATSEDNARDLAEKVLTGDAYNCVVVPEHWIVRKENKRATARRERYVMTERGIKDLKQKEPIF